MMTPHLPEVCTPNLVSGCRSRHPQDGIWIEFHSRTCLLSLGVRAYWPEGRSSASVSVITDV
jgi:hypothetical protein